VSLEESVEHLSDPESSELDSSGVEVPGMVAVMVVFSPSDVSVEYMTSVCVGVGDGVGISVELRGCRSGERVEGRLEVLK
jgi:hypothetical protein